MAAAGHCQLLDGHAGIEDDMRCRQHASMWQTPNSARKQSLVVVCCGHCNRQCRKTCGFRTSTNRGSKDEPTPEPDLPRAHVRIQAIHRKKEHVTYANQEDSLHQGHQKVHNCQNAPLLPRRCSRMLKKGASKLSSCLTRSLLHLYSACYARTQVSSEGFGMHVLKAVSKPGVIYNMCARAARNSHLGLRVLRRPVSSSLAN